MGSVGITNIGRSINFILHLWRRRINSWLLQRLEQTQELLDVISLRLSDISKQQVDLHRHVGTTKEARASMSALGDVVQAPSGAMYSPSTKLYNQVPVSMYHLDWEPLKITGLSNMRDSTTEILQLRYLGTIPTGTSGVSKTTGLKISQNTSLSMILSLRISNSDNVKFLYSRFSMDPSLQIMGSTGPKVESSTGTVLGKSPEDPFGTISRNICSCLASSRNSVLAPSQRSFRYTSVGTLSSSVRVMPEAVIIGYQAVCKRSIWHVTLSNSILETAIPLIRDCSASLEIRSLANVLPDIHMYPLALDGIFATFIYMDNTNIEPGEHSQALIEELLQLSLPFPSFSISLQMILNIRSFSGPGTAGSKRVTHSEKATATDIFDGIPTRHLLALRSVASASVDTGSQNWTLKNLGPNVSNITTNTSLIGNSTEFHVLSIDVHESRGMYQWLREVKAEQIKGEQSIRRGGKSSVIASQAKYNLRMVHEALDIHVQLQQLDLWRFISEVMHALEGIRCTLRPWMILPFIHSANAHPTNLVPEGIVNPSALEVVSIFGCATYFGQRMASAVGFQLNQNGSIYGLILLSIAITGISSFILHDSNCNGLAYLVLFYILFIIGAVFRFWSSARIRCSCGGKGCLICGGGGTSGNPD